MSASIVGRARQAGLVEIRIRNIRDYTHDRHHTADDTPYGGGAGMVMKVEPVVEAVEAAKADCGQHGGGPAQADCRVIYLTPQGHLYDQQTARRLAKLRHLILLCGHYEGIDERVCELVVDEEISIGDYVLTGGELPAMVVVDSVVRLLPGVVGNPDSILEESFWERLLDYPHYTRPAEYRGVCVPEVLLSGHHAQIERWRRRKALEKTLKQRPELLDRIALTPEDRQLLEEIRREQDEQRD